MEFEEHTLAPGSSKNYDTRSNLLCFSCALKSRGRVFVRPLSPSQPSLSSIPQFPQIIYPAQSNYSVSEEFLMEQPKQDPENKATIPTDDKSPKSDPKEGVQTANGDGNWANFVMGSENQIPTTQNEQPVISTPSSGSKKSVRWSTELVTESPSVASSAHGSNFNASSAPSSSASFKGIVSVSLICGSVSLICICAFVWRVSSLVMIDG